MAVLEAAPHARLHAAAEAIRERLKTRIVGLGEVTELLLTSLFAGGHCLLVGVPGLAKTLLVRSVAESLDLVFRRIQFTPDLMPSDVTGAEVIQENAATGAKEFQWTLQTPDGLRRFEITGPFESDDGDVLTGWALDGRGIVMKPIFEVAEHLRQGQLVPVATANPPVKELPNPAVPLFAAVLMTKSVALKPVTPPVVEASTQL